MRKAIFCSREGGETRICMLVSGKLVNVDAEGPHGASIARNIYKGRVTGVSRSLNAAFVDIGEGKEGFLSIQDVHPAILEGYGRGAGMQDIFSMGQEILVQVLRDAVKDKGPVLTTCISLPGRYIVLIPAVERMGISKKLPDEERKRLRDLISEVEIPEGFGVIVRTAGRNQRREEMLADLGQLVAQWNRIETAYTQAPAVPALLVKEQSVAVRFLREYFTEDVAEVFVDDEELAREVLDGLGDVMPRLAKVIKRYTDPLPLFVRYGVENQIEKMFLRDVPLPSGGRIVIDKTEALTAIDVNSGRTRTRDVEETALQANLEAAEEIANQLMLRDLGGLVVIDFIDMNSARNRRKVQDLLEKSFEEDKARVNFGKISGFGLLEMTRQRMRSGVVTQATHPCPRCDGVGYVRSVSSSALQTIRRVRELAASGHGNLITVTAPVEVANFMQNALRELVYRLEKERGIKVAIIADPAAMSETVEHGETAAAAPAEGAKRTAPRTPDAPTAQDAPADLAAQAPPRVTERPAQPGAGEPAPTGEPGRSRRRGSRRRKSRPESNPQQEQQSPPESNPQQEQQSRPEPTPPSRSQPSPQQATQSQAEPAATPDAHGGPKSEPGEGKGEKDKSRRRGRRRGRGRKGNTEGGGESGAPTSSSEERSDPPAKDRQARSASPDERSDRPEDDRQTRSASPDERSDRPEDDRQTSAAASEKQVGSPARSKQTRAAERHSEDRAKADAPVPESGEIEAARGALLDGFIRKLLKLK